MDDVAQRLESATATATTTATVESGNLPDDVASTMAHQGYQAVVEMERTKRE